MIRTLLLSIIFGMLLSCGNADISRRLDHAESLLESHPDSALSILSHIDTGKLNNEENNAKYNLLLTQSIVKSGYSLSSDSLIEISLSFYRDKGVSKELMKALFYKGFYLSNSGELPEAMLNTLKAHEIAVEFNDYYWRAKTAEQIADILTDTYNYTEVPKYRKEAIEYYKKANRIRNHLFAICDLGSSIGSNGDINKGLELIDSVRNIAAYIQKDSMLLAYCYSAELPLLLFSENYSKADQCLDKIEETAFYTLSGREYAYKSMIELHNNNFEAAYQVISDASKSVTKPSDRAVLLLAFSSYYKQKGQFDSAVFYTDSILVIQNQEISDKLKRSAVSAQRDYYNNKAKQQEQANRKLSLTIFVCIIIAIIVSVILLLINRFRIKLKNIEIEKKVDDILILSNKIQEQNDNIKQLNIKLSNEVLSKDSFNRVIEELFHKKWELLNLLCNEYFEKGGSEKTRITIIKDIENEILKMRSKKNLKSIESAVNQYMDNIVVKLREQCPFIKEDDIIFITLLFAGFSPRAVCLFTDIKLKYYYNKKSRLIDRILSSEAPDKALFVEEMK